MRDDNIDFQPSSRGLTAGSSEESENTLEKAVSADPQPTFVQTDSLTKKKELTKEISKKIRKSVYNYIREKTGRNPQSIELINKEMQENFLNIRALAKYFASKKYLQTNNLTKKHELTDVVRKNIRYDIFKSIYNKIKYNNKKQSIELIKTEMRENLSTMVTLAKYFSGYNRDEVNTEASAAINTYQPKIKRVTRSSVDESIDSTFVPTVPSSPLRSHSVFKRSDETQEDNQQLRKKSRLV